MFSNIYIWITATGTNLLQLLVWVSWAINSKTSWLSTVALPLCFMLFILSYFLDRTFYYSRCTQAPAKVRPWWFHLWDEVVKRSIDRIFENPCFHSTRDLQLPMETKNAQFFRRRLCEIYLDQFTGRERIYSEHENSCRCKCWWWKIF